MKGLQAGFRSSREERQKGASTRHKGDRLVTKQSMIINENPIKRIEPLSPAIFDKGWFLSGWRSVADRGQCQSGSVTTAASNAKVKHVLQPIEPSQRSNFFGTA